MDISHLHVFQQQAITSTLNEIEQGNNRIHFVMTPGSGTHVVASAIVRSFINGFRQKHSPKILIVCHGTSGAQTIANGLKEEKKLSIFNKVQPTYGENAEVTIIQQLDLDNADTVDDIIKAEQKFDMVFIVGGGEHDEMTRAILDLYKDAIQISMTNREIENTRFGPPISVYSLKDGIGEGLIFTSYVVTKHVVLEEELREPFENITNAAKQQIVIANKRYIEKAAEMLVDITKNHKTVIYLPTPAIAQSFVELINRLANSPDYALAVFHGMELSERLEVLKRYRDEKKKPFILCLTSANAVAVDLSPTKYLALFKEPHTVDELQNMITPALRPFPGKKDLKILDFLGLDSLFAKLDGTEASEEQQNIQTEVPSILPFFKNAHIAFRDKKDIEGVLGVDVLAEELAEIVKMMPAEQGSMIGIFGKWGRGKTFLMDQTWKKLEAKENNGKFIRVDFHAWKYQDTPATWAYLYECLSAKYLEPKSECWLFKKLEKAFALLSLNLQREKYWPVFKLAAIILIAIPSFGLVKELSALIGGDIEDTLKSLGITLISSASIITIYNSFKKDWSSKAKDLFLKYGTKHSFKEHLGLQAEIQKETITLLKTWIPKKKIGKKKIVLFVEDIDRCAEEKIIQLIDSLRVLLEDNDIAERIIILTAVDEKILRHAIKTKYQALIETSNDQSKGTSPSDKLINEYIDKLFIAGLKLGVLSTSDADEFLLALTKKDREDKSITSLQQLIENDASQAYSRQSQVIQDGLLIQNLENAQYQDDYYDNEEPDLAPLYLESSELVQSEKDPLAGQKATSENDELTFNLTDDEVDILRVAFAKYSRATPRQIRILYYRYLIAKNMLIRRYRHSGRTNVWQLQKNSKIMATLIVAYMMNDDQGLLHKHFAQVVQYGDDARYNVNLLQETYVMGYDYKELLNTLTVVIAY